MRLSTLLATSFCAVVVPLAPATAQAIVAQSSGLPFPARTIHFGTGSFPDGTPISTEFAGLTIGHAAYFTTTTLVNVAGGFLANDPAATGPDTVTIRFAQSVGDVSFVYHQIGTTGPTTIRAVLQGNTVDSFQLVWNETQPNNFFGSSETALDELQIDFVGDFRLDELAFNPVGGASCNPYNGSNVNPAGFGCLTLPVLGDVWRAQVWNTPSTLFTALVYAPAGLGPAVPLFGGELLVDASSPLIAFTGGLQYAIPIPPQASWVGTTLAFQAVRFELVGGAPVIVPMNAMLLMLGL